MQNRQIASTLSSTPLFFPGSPSLLPSQLVPLPPCQTVQCGWEMGACGQFVISLLLLPPHTFPLLWWGTFHRLKSLRLILFQCGGRLHFLQEISTSSSLGPLCAAVWLSAPVLHRLQGNLCSSTWSIPLSSLTFMSAGLFSYFLSPHFSVPCSVFHFLKCIFPVAPPVWLRSSAVPCDGSAGVGWNHLCLPWGSPWPPLTWAKTLTNPVTNKPLPPPKLYHLHLILFTYQLWEVAQHDIHCHCLKFEDALCVSPSYLFTESHK